MAEEEWAEVRSLALAAHGEWEAEERARREGEAGEAPPAAAMEAQREEIYSLALAFEGNEEATRYLRGVAHVACRNHTLPHAGRVALMEASVQNVRALGLFGVQREGEVAFDGDAGRRTKVKARWPRDGTPI